MLKMIMKAVMFCSCVILLLTSCDAILPNKLASGTPVWARSAVGGNTASDFISVCVVSDGIVAAGYFYSGILQLGNTISANGVFSGPNMLIAKYDFTGKPLWTKYPFFADSTSGYFAVASSSDAVYAGGWISSHSYDLGDSIIIGASIAARAVIVKYSLFGTTLWARTISGPYEVMLSDIAVYNNSIYVVGYLYDGSLYDFGNSVQLSGPYADSNPFIAKFDENGLAEWAYSIVSGPKANFTAVAVGNEGVYVAGTISGNGTTDYGNGVTTTSYFSGQNPVVIKYNVDGEAQWAATTLNGTSDDAAFSAIDIGNGGVYAAGGIMGPGLINFGGVPVVKGSNESLTCVIVKYDKDGKTQWARTSLFGAFSSNFKTIKYWNNSVYACGVINGFTTFGFGNGVFVDALCESNPLIVKYDQAGASQWARSSVFPSGGNSFSSYECIDVNLNGVFAAGRIRGDTLYFGNSLCLQGINEIMNIALVKYTE